MAAKFWQFLLLLFAALYMGATFAHVLEMPVKLGYDPKLYTAVNSSLYINYAWVGAALQVAAILITIILLVIVRHRHRLFRWTLAGCALLWSAFLAWWLIVFPVNARVGESAREVWPDLWLQLRPRWEVGHLVSFILLLLGFCVLTISVLRRHDSNEMRCRRSAPLWFPD